ncbi:MAG: DUF4340 domain-containing protein [Planctomycetia bacterium]|nr:DUF4340 domain-containing protein [Planctomycetia bacterium]
MKIRNTVILFGLFAIALLTFAAFQWLNIKTGEESKHAERFVFPDLNPFNPRKESPEQPKDPFAKDQPKGPQQAQPEEFTRFIIDRYQHEAGKHQRIEFQRKASGKTSKWTMVSPVQVRTDDAQITSLIRSLITLERPKTREKERDLAKLGLDKPDTTITLTRGDKDYVLSLGATGPATKDPVYYSLSSDGNNRPFLLAKSKIEKLFDDLASYRDKSLISSSFGHNGLKLAGTARPLMELAKDKDWVFKQPALGEADTPATDELTRQLSGIRVERNEDFVLDTTDQAKLAEYGVSDDKPVYTFSITQNPIDPKDKPVVEQVLIGNADETAIRQAKQARIAALVVDSLTSPTTALAAYVARDKQPAEPAYYYARLAGDSSIVRIPARNIPILKKSADELRLKNLAKLDNSKIDAAYISTGSEKIRIYRPDLQGAASWDIYANDRSMVKCQPAAIQSLLDAVAKIEIKDVRAFLDDDAKLKSWFGDASIDLGLDKPVATIELWKEGILRNKDNKPEGDKEPRLRDDIKAKPTVKLTIGKKDDARKVVYVKREMPDVKPVILAVPDPFVAGDSAGAMQANAAPPDGRQLYSLSNLATRGYLAYRDRSLPSFRLDQVTGVEVKRPDVTYVLERTEANDERGKLAATWKLTKPVEGSPNAGVADYLISSLMGASSDNLLNDQATEKVMDEEYGLIKTPLLQVVVKTKPDSDKPATAYQNVPKAHPGGTFIYTIGKKITNNARYPNHFAARIEAQLLDKSTPNSNAFVLAVPASFVQSLDLELRNTTIYPEEKSRPDSLKLTWNTTTADKKTMATSLELKLNNEQWEIVKLTENGKDNKALLPKLEQARINALLRYGPQPAPGGPSINPWVVDRFLQNSGKVDASYRLDPSNASLPPLLTIEAKYSDGKSRTIILGSLLKPDDRLLPAWSGSQFHYCASPNLAGAVMLVHEPTWRLLIQGPGYFAPAEPKPAQ